MHQAGGIGDRLERRLLPAKCQEKLAHCQHREQDAERQHRRVRRPSPDTESSREDGKPRNEQRGDSLNVCITFGQGIPGGSDCPQL